MSVRSVDFLRRSAVAALVVMSIAACGCPSTARAQFPGGGGGGRHGGGGGGGRSDEKAKPPYRPPPAQGVLTVHGGEYLATKAFHFEVVFLPLQTHIYLYDAEFKPLSARNLHAQLSVQVPFENGPRQMTLVYVPPPQGSCEQDFVSTQFDVRPLIYRPMPVTVDFRDLPDRSEPSASFTPLLSEAKVRPYVSRVLATEADRDGVTRQQVCPVCGAALGSHGPVVKMYIAECPLFLCGEDCIPTVKKSPERFLPQSPPPPTMR